MGDMKKSSSCGIVYRVIRPKKAVFCNKNGDHLPKVLALHGWMGDGLDLVPLSNRLANAGLIVFVPDLPFHSSSLQVGADSCAIAARKIFSSFLELCVSEESVDNIGCSSFSVLLIGYSMGGRLAFEILRAWNDIAGDSEVNLHGAIFISSSLPPNSNRECSQISKQEARTSNELSAITSGTEYEIWLRNTWYSKSMWGNLTSHSDFNCLIARRVHCFNTVQLQNWSSASRNLGKSTMASCSNTFRVPVLYMYGALDSKYSAMRTNYQQVFHNAHFVRIEMCGHNVVLERLSLVSSSIVSFLARQCLTIPHILVSPITFEYSPYSIQLRKSMSIGNQTINSRNGFLLRVSLSNGCTGVADVAPLPGWHDISVEQAKAEVIETMTELCNFLICAFCFAPRTLSTALTRTSPLTSSAIEAAFINALAKSIGFDLTTYIKHIEKTHFQKETNLVRMSLQCQDTSRADRVVSLNGVLPRTLPGVKRDDTLITFITESRFKTLKLKVGSAANVEDDVEFVRLATNVASSRQKMLRLDANQSWTMKQWISFRDGVGEAWKLIEFIEEPLKFRADLRTALQANEHFPKIALDESITQFSNTELNSLLPARNCCAVVIKPSMFRSIAQIFELCSVADANNKRIIFSSTFESGVGLAWLSNLSFACCQQTNSSDVDNGLATFGYLKHDAITPHFGEYCLVQDSALDVNKCSRYLEMANQSSKFRELSHEDLPV